MILRESDWGYYPGAIIDDTTQNKHFIRFADSLRKLGVKHWYLVLALHNPQLQGVNPHASDLTIQQQGMIIEECAENPWYYLRECIRVPADGTDGVPFKIDRGNFAMFWIFFNNIDSGIEFLRQHGKTVGMCSLMSWLLRFLEKSRTILVTKGPVLREETITKLKELRNGLPKYLWPMHPDDPDNKESFACLAMGNKLITAIGQNDEQSANGVGRGLTAGRLFSDEGPFTNNIHIILPAALASGTAARQINEANGVPYGNVFATTPGDLATPEGKYMYELMNSGIVWDERLIDVPTRDQLIKLILANSMRPKMPRVMFYVKFNHRQLGTSDEKLASMIANATGSPDQIRRDFGGEWTTGGFNKPFSGEDADRMNKSRMRASFKDISPSNYITDWYYEEDEMVIKLQDRHILGLDTSEAVGRDAIAMSIVNSVTAEYAGKLTINETNVIGFAIHLAEFMVQYPNTVLILERRSTGSSVADAIILQLQSKVTDLHRRLYVKITQDYSRNDELYKEYARGPGNRPELFWDKFRKYIGFATDGEKRKKLYGEVFTMALRLSAHLLRSGELIDQILSLVERNGRIDHQRSGHDDLVISWLLAMWLLIFGKNLNHYGISNNRLMIRNRNMLAGRGDNKDEDAQVEQEERQLELMGEIEQVMKQMAGVHCPVRLMGLKARLHSLIDQLETDVRNVASMESLKELIQRQRMK